MEMILNAIENESMWNSFAFTPRVVTLYDWNSKVIWLQQDALIA